MSLLIVILAVIVSADANETFLSVLHINDIHTHEKNEQVHESAGTDQENSYLLTQMPTIINIIKWSMFMDSKNKMKTLIVNTGSFTGGAWVGNKFKETVTLLNKMRIDISSLGHYGTDFNDSTGSAAFLERLDFPVLCSNPDEVINRLAPSHRIKINDFGNQIGFIGYYTPHVESSDKTKYLKQIEAIRNESKALKRAGVKTIIAVGHSGRKTEINFAMNTADVDMYIGGHSTRFYKSGEIEKKYPVFKLVEEYEGLRRRYTFLTIDVPKKYLFVSKFILSVDVETGNIRKAEGVPIPSNVEKLFLRTLEEMQERKVNTSAIVKSKKYRSEADRCDRTVLFVLSVFFLLCL